MTVSVSVVVLTTLVLVILLLLVVIWSLKGRRDPNFQVDTEAPLDRLIPSLAGLSHGVLTGGNAVEIVQNGAFFDAVLSDVQAAERSVHLETFLWKKGEIGSRVAEALAERSQAGVEVRILVDANGSRDMGEATERLLEEAGCTLVKHHRGRLNTLGRINNRDHRKIIIVDGRVGYVGGHCIVDTWLGEAQDGKHYRDLSVRIRGPVVHSLQATFSENWVLGTGELFLGDGVFPILEQKGDVAVHVARIRPANSASAVEILHHLAICCAQERIWIQNPYFLPDPDGIKALIRAVRRGVDVRVMSPSAKASDFPLVQHAAHHNYGTLLKGGIRIFEYQKTLLHQKVMTVDGVWCAIGSSNFDDRSFEINDEVTLGFHDAALAAQLEDVFEHDLKACRELASDAWERRGLKHRLTDGAAYLINEQL